MIFRHVVLIILVACAVSCCDDCVSKNYSTRANAEAENLFERGWLPQIIPLSSRDISVHSDLDLNISNGEFSFDASDYDVFVTQLERVPDRDESGSLAYAYEDWIFWFSGEKNHCRYYFRLSKDN